jgi:pimeloyl-ACP methyl ester carboxylesterase
MHREALEVLPEILIALGIERPILFGHSDGGSIALIYAGSGAPPPAALIVEAAHVFVEDVTVARIAELDAPYRAGPLRERLQRHHGGDVDRLFDGWTATWLSAAFRGWNIEGCLPAITSPLLVIQGRDDEYGTLAQVRAIAEGAAGRVETLVLDDCRHAPHVDQRDRVLDASARWIQHGHTGL